MSDGYIHGFSEREQKRLVDQARTMADAVFGEFDFSSGERLLEIGCGVGAQLKMLHERWPHLQLSGVDRNPHQLARAAEVLNEEVAAGHVTLFEGDATALPFPDDHFDRALTIWLLEHSNNPAPIIREALRVVKPGGEVILTEVDNHTFGFTPELPAIRQWWDHFSQFQADGGGDPWIGGKLLPLLDEMGLPYHSEGFREMISSRREPHRRDELRDYLKQLLLSGKDQLLSGGYISEEATAALLQAFDSLAENPSTEFQYHAMRVFIPVA